MADAELVLAGNPNVGKSTVFNCLTGMHQHTGNWAGKTVASAQGRWKTREFTVNLIDVPGCYSLEATSAEEEVARDCICSPKYGGIIIVCDGTCIERNLILVLQILKHRSDIILCVNLMDQVRRRGLSIDSRRLSEILGITVITTESAKKKEMKKKIEAAVAELLTQDRSSLVKAREYIPELTYNPEQTAKTAESIARAVLCNDREREDISIRVDRILTNPIAAFPLMALLLFLVFWITVKGANYPSELLGNVLFSLEKPLYDALLAAGAGEQACEMLASGVYRVLAWVVSVMLPPMAIFFPLFTLLEDWGLLPRIAFNMDKCFASCNACGKQALTMCMGLGCNASAVLGCRIIDSRRERLLAMMTNSLMPCNGRFPMLIAVITMFFARKSETEGAVAITLLILCAVFATFLLTKLLSVTLLKGLPSSFALELPPYRKPDIGKVIVRSVMDRTIFVLARAASVAAPAGLLIWVLANTEIAGASLIEYMTGFFEPIGQLMGLDGVILVAFILGLPANEIVLPIAMMIYLSSGTLAEVGDVESFRILLVNNGWSMLTALNVMIFSVMHWPCATTLLSIKKETGSLYWTTVAFAAPLVMGTALCCISAALWRILL